MNEIAEILLSDSEIDKTLFESLGCEENIIFMLPSAINTACERLEDDASRNMPFKEIVHKRNILQKNIKKITTLCFIKELEEESLSMGVSVSTLLDVMEVKEKKLLAINKSKRLVAIATTLLIGIYVFTAGVESRFLGLCFILMLLSNGLIFGKANKWIDSCVGKINLVMSARKELNL